MTRAPAVSALMPTYEQHAFVRRALDDLVAQKLGDCEAIVVDGSRSDATADAIAPCLADARIRYARATDDRGLGHALDRALDMARADNVWRERDRFTFDRHGDALIDFLRAAIAQC